MNWDLENRTVQRAAGDRWWSKRIFQSRFILAFGLRVLLITESYIFPLKFLSSASSTLSRSPQRCRFLSAWGDASGKCSPEAHQVGQVSLTCHLPAEAVSTKPVCEPSVAVAVWHTGWVSLWATACIFANVLHLAAVFVPLGAISIMCWHALLL